MSKENPFSGTIDVEPLIQLVHDTMFESFGEDYLKLFPEDSKVLDELKKLPNEHRKKIIVEAVNNKKRIHETDAFIKLIEENKKAND